MSQQVTIPIQNFTGLNLREPVSRIQDTELRVCKNFNIGRAGELEKRSGFEQIHDGTTLGANQVRVIGMFFTDTFSQLFFRAGNELYYTDDGDTVTLVSGGPWNNTEFGVQYVDKFYIVRSDDIILEWDGTTMTTIAGSPNGDYCHIFKDRLFIINSTESGTLNSRLHFSTAGDPTDWPSTNFIDINPGDGDALTTLYNLQDSFLVFKGTSTWTLVIQGDPSTWLLKALSPEVGCLSKYTIREFEGFLVFLGPDGVHRTDGNFFDSISENLLPEFDGLLTSPGQLNKSSAALWKEKYILMLETFPESPTWGSQSDETWDAQEDETWGGQGAVRRYFVYHFRIQGWTQWVPHSSINPHTFQEVNVNSDFRGLYTGELAASGFIHRLSEVIFQDNSQNYTAEFETKEFDFELPDLLKRGKYLGLILQADGLHTFQNIVNTEAQPAASITTESANLYYKVKGPQYFRTWRFKGSATHSGPFAFYTATLHLHRKRSVIQSGV